MNGGAFTEARLGGSDVALHNRRDEPLDRLLRVLARRHHAPADRAHDDANQEGSQRAEEQSPRALPQPDPSRGGGCGQANQQDPGRMFCDP